MRLLMIVGVVLLGGLAVRGDTSTDRLYEFSTGAAYANNRLDLYIYLYSQIWLNGRHLGPDEFELHLKPGDIVEGFICGDYSRVVRFRLDRLTRQRADLTVWNYSAVAKRNDMGGLSHSRGRLLMSYPLVIDLTKDNFALVDYGPEHVQAGDGLPSRSKPLR